MATAPLVPQGTLNRVRCSIVVPNYTTLNITAPYMGRNFATITFEGDFTKLIGTGTGGVPSPEPYVMASISVGILRTQALASSWRTQWETQGAIGAVSIFSDTAAFSEFDLSDCVIQHFDPSAYDGEDPVSRLTIMGIYNINSAMWSLT
ncbi:MAG: hypothetical protein KGI38_12215 [Thaumarchaeota archaeon]|nr:hypothetical protein [Nitrososphaerota archaeon]